MYGKIWKSMFEGSLYDAGWEAIVTFMVLITFANKTGEVDITVSALSGKTTIPKEHLENGLAILMEPDTLSRTKEDDGRRLVLIDEDRPWGWRIVNYEKYSNARDMAAIRQYWAEEQKVRRRKKREELEPF